MPVKIKDIAQKLNLSISTVSYALNDGPKPVSREVNQRVQKLAKDLGYRPNRLARSLVTRRTRTIGIVPIDIGADILLTPGTPPFLNGAFNAAARLRQDVLVFTAHDRNLPNEVVDDMLDSRVDGVLLIAPRLDSPALKQIGDSSLPYAIAAGDENHARCYFTNNIQGTRAAVTHLLELGHRKIAHVTGNMALADAVVRRDTFLDVMREAGLSVPEPYVVIGDYWRPSGHRAGLIFAELEPRPTAVFCANDDMAFGLLDALRERDIAVPDEISVVGFDDAPGTCYAGLTTVHQPLQQMAEDAFEAVVRQLQSGEIPPGRHYDANLVVRASTARALEASS